MNLHMPSVALRCVALRCVALRCVALHIITIPIPIPCNAIQCNAMQCNACICANVQMRDTRMHPRCLARTHAHKSKHSHKHVHARTEVSCLSIPTIVTQDKTNNSIFNGKNYIQKARACNEDCPRLC